VKLNTLLLLVVAVVEITAAAAVPVGSELVPGLA
jgi:hypothetical protein